MRDEGRTHEHAWRPEDYDDVVATIPGYARLQAETVAATIGLHADTILELGAGTGVTSQALLDAHPEARLVGIDSSQAMLERARSVLPRERVTLVHQHLEDALPEGPFDLVVSALAVHHLDNAGKRDLFARIAGALTVRGRFVLADVVVPADPADVRVELDPGFDLPGTVDEQAAWLTAVGLEARPAWIEGDLAVIVASAARR